MAEMAIARRQFLQTGGALAVGFVLAPSTAALAQRLAAGGKSLAGDMIDSFLVIARDGRVTLYSGVVDLGTGARVANRQIVAEELDVPFARVDVIEGDTALVPDQGTTGGSRGIVFSAMQIRQAAATARKALLAMAAKNLGVAAGELSVSDGVVRAANGKSVSYGELIAGGHFDLKLDKDAPLKDPGQYKIVNQALPRPDLPGKMTGRHTYVQDFRLPGMLHARIVRPRAIGASVVSVDESSIAAIPGARVVRVQNFVAVVADREWNAIRASKALRVNWSGGGGLPGSERVHAGLKAQAVDHDEELIKQGQSGPALNRAPAAQRFAASYEWPAQSHASMGPSCAVANVKDGEATVWSASQGPHNLRKVLARGLGLAEDKIRVIYLDGAGCYGMNGHDDAAADAALLSRTLGQPVRVQWSREDEHGWDPKGPPQLLELRGALDASGAIAAWESEAWLPVNTPNLSNRAMLSFEAAGIPQPKGQSVAQVQGNAYPPYAVANLTGTVHWLASTPLRPSNLRAPGKLGNCFGVECFMDEMAVAAKRDPLEFRLAHLKDEVGLSIMKKLGERMSWKSRPSPNPASRTGNIALGRGLAYVHYKHVDNRLGLGIEVAVNRTTGKVQVTRVVCIYEAGLMINPDAVRAQVEGNILQAVSRTLHEEVLFDEAGVTSVDWSSYPILTFPDAPAIDIELIGTVRDKPLGAGEAASAPVPAALGNAVFDATGVRLRKVPFTNARMRKALLNKGQA